MIKHMQQVGGILTEYSDSVFTLQGLFVGNWGELNGTKYADQQSLQQLAKQLVKSTDSQMYLAVRTPVQWRKILESADADLQEDRKNPLYDRLGLFNDGMLGSGNDCGTYGEKVPQRQVQIRRGTAWKNLLFRKNCVPVCQMAGRSS